jgi:hypothetical protein
MCGARCPVATLHCHPTPSDTYDFQKKRGAIFASKLRLWTWIVSLLAAICDNLPLSTQKLAITAGSQSRHLLSLVDRSFASLPICSEFHSPLHRSRCPFTLYCILEMLHTHSSIDALRARSGNREFVPYPALASERLPRVAMVALAP